MKQKRPELSQHLKNRPTVSVIVPIYNAERYLHRCLDSLLRQTFTNFEAILIDDGSTDKSGDICEGYASKDNRFRVIHQSNAGVATARQRGIENARGIYSIHCDADDYAEPDWLEVLYNEASTSNADMTLCDYYWETPDSRSIKHVKPHSLKSHDVLIEVLQLKMLAATYNKLIRNDLYKKYSIRFHPGMCYSEDMLVICDLLAHDIKIAYVDKPLYHYQHMNLKSLTAKKTNKHVESNMELIEHIESSTIYDKDAQNSLYYIKLWTKELMYYQADYPSRKVIETYKEINKQFCDLYRKGRYPGDRTLYILLNGHPIVASFLKQMGKIKTWLNK